MGEAAISKQIEKTKQAHPFDWINGIKIRFVRDSNIDGHLKEPVSIWQVLQKLSREHQLDVLPEDVLENFPDDLTDPISQGDTASGTITGGDNSRGNAFKGKDVSEMAEKYPKFVKLGEHDIDIGLTFKGDIKKKFTIRMELVSSSQEMETLRKMRASEKPVFLLGVRERKLAMADAVEDEEV